MPLTNYKLRHFLRHTSDCCRRSKAPNIAFFPQSHALELCCRSRPTSSSLWDLLRRSVSSYLYKRSTFRILISIAPDGLYSKITGAQRIDLFGAQKADLPSIWKELIEAGFESGHAYGKALRSVKSCVGTNWCRYGIGDSVGSGYYLAPTLLSFTDARSPC